MEDIKKELNSYIQDKKFIKEMENDLDELITKATKVTSEIDQVKTNSSNNAKDKMAEYAAQIVDMKNMKYEKLIEMYKKKEGIERKIDIIEQPYKNILYLKYIKNYTLEKIADFIGYSYIDVCRKHGTALKKYKELKDDKK